MAQNLFQIFFGNQAEEVMDSYRQLSQLHTSRQYLLQNKEEIETDLAQFNEQHRDLEQDQKKLTRMENDVKQKTAQLKQLERNRAQVDRSLASGWQRFCAGLMSSLSSSYDSVADMEAMQKQLNKDISQLQRELRALQKGLGQFRQEVKRDSRSQDSFEFARDQLQKDIEGLEQAIRDADDAINLQIQDLAVGFPLQALMYKSLRITDSGKREELMEQVMNLRHAARSRAMLSATPEATPEERKMPFGVVDVVKGVKRGFVEELADMAGRLQLSGHGHAHKKVRSGNSTSWKKINVSFSGPCHAVFRIESSDWGYEPLIKCLQEQSRDQFAVGLSKGRAKYASKLLATMTQEVSTGTRQLRHLLEASLN